VIFEIPDAVEAQGYSKATKARLDGAKLRELGWKPVYDIRSGMRRTMEILGQI
jgi:nucleoside-diphosphate-sugar epimerase